MIKALYLERFNRTFRRKIHEYLANFHQKRFIDKLDNIVVACNQAKHSSTEFALLKIDKSNAEEINAGLYKKNKV